MGSEMCIRDSLPYVSNPYQSCFRFPYFFIFYFFLFIFLFYCLAFFVIGLLLIVVVSQRSKPFLLNSTGQPK